MSQDSAHNQIMQKNQNDNSHALSLPLISMAVCVIGSFRYFGVLYEVFVSVDNDRIATSP